MNPGTEHTLHDEPDSYEAEVGVMYCRACGWPIKSLTNPDRVFNHTNKPCTPVKIGLR